MRHGQHSQLHRRSLNFSRIPSRSAALSGSFALWLVFTCPARACRQNRMFRSMFCLNFFRVKWLSCRFFSVSLGCQAPGAELKACDLLLGFWMWPGSAGLSFGFDYSWVVSGATRSSVRTLEPDPRSPNISRRLPGDVIQLTASSGQENPHDCLDIAAHEGQSCLLHAAPVANWYAASLPFPMYSSSQDTTLPNSKGKTSTKTKPHIWSVHRATQ